MNCKNCGHPHGWYEGLCAACAAKASIKVELGVIPSPPIEAPVAEPKAKVEPPTEEAEPEAPKPTTRRVRRAKK